MKDTLVKMKDGRIFQSPIHLFRPIEGFLVLFGNDEKLYFNDMVSATTKMGDSSFINGVAHFSDTDEIKRAEETKALLLSLSE